MLSPLNEFLLEPFARIGREFAHVLRELAVVAVILAVGGAAAAVARYAVYGLLTVLRFDRLAARSGLAGGIERVSVFRSASDFAARLVQGMLWLITMLAALDAIDSSLTSGLVARFVNYMPALVTAGLTLLLGLAISKFLARSALLAAVNAQWRGARLVAGAVRVLIVSLAVAIALDELRVGQTVILVSFAILFGGTVVAGAIAFGLGARDIARNWLRSKIEKGQPEDEQVFHHL